MTNYPIIGAVSKVMTGEPVIYISDPLGKSFAVVESAQLWNGDKPGDSFRFKRIRTANFEEVAALHARSGFNRPLAARAWYEVCLD